MPRVGGLLGARGGVVLGHGFLGEHGGSDDEAAVMEAPETMKRIRGIRPVLAGNATAGPTLLP